MSSSEHRERKRTGTSQKDFEEAQEVPSLYREFYEARQLLYRSWGPVLLLTLASFIVAWFFVEPAPPHLLKIAAGPREGAYYQHALQYAKVFEANGYKLEVVETAGSIENYELLLADNDIHLAIIQGGTKPPEVPKEALEAIASLYFEPLWIFTRGDSTPQDLRELAGLRVGIGAEESGTAAIMKLLLTANGLLPPGTGPLTDITPESARQMASIQPIPVGGQRAIDHLMAGELDAASFVLPADHPLIERLLSDPELRLLQLKRHRTYSQLYPYLSNITLYEGVIDLEQNIPAADSSLLAPAANLIANFDLHDAFVPLLIKAAVENHSPANLLVPQGKFPSLEFAEFKAHPAALDYFEYGPSFLNRYLPFWLASLINRTKIMILPLLTLAIPLMKLAPPIYRWQIRSRIYRWYDLIRKIDQTQQVDSAETLSRHLRTLEKMSYELKEMNVPLSYMEEFYNLHLHIDLIKRRIENQSALLQKTEQTETSVPSTPQIH